MIKAELIDYMGSDLTVVNAARVSFDKESEAFSGGDSRLIAYLAKHNHFTPFTHCMITMRETVPIFIARQRFKHMVGFTYNEISRRYVDTPPEFYYPDEWREKSENKKQGSGGVHRYSDDIDSWYGRYITDCIYSYEKLISDGVAPEQARMVLPQSMMTSYYVTGSLAAWARAHKLRIAEDSQQEIQTLAKQWDEIIKPLYPESWEALTNDIS